MHPAPGVPVAAQPLAPESRTEAPCGDSVTGHHHVFPIDCRPRGFSPPRRLGSASATSMLQLDRTGFTPFLVHVDPKIPFASDQHGPAPGSCCKQRNLGEDDCAIPGVRAPLEGSRSPAAAPCHQVACPPAVRHALARFATDFKALFRRGIRTRNRRCRRVLRALSFHGFLVPLRAQLAGRSLNAPPPRDRSHLAMGDCRSIERLAVARPRSSSWGRTPCPAHLAVGGVASFAGSREPWMITEQAL